MISQLYIDPSSMTLGIQVLGATLVGAGITIKIYWYKIKFKLKKHIHKSQ
jgi:hypothetical protein